MNWLGLIFVVSGLFTAAVGICDWDLFFEHPRAWVTVKLLGRKGARALHIVLGMAFVVLGVLIFTGIVPIPTPRR